MENEELLKAILNYLDENIKQPNTEIVPVSGSVLTSSDILSIIQCALSGWVTEGKYSAKLSNGLKKYVGTKYARLVNSGSSANLIAFISVVDMWRERANYRQFKIITPACGFPTTVSPIMQNNFIPLFVDTNPSTLNPNMSPILEALSHHEVAGIIMAHTLGFPFQADLIRKRCDELGKFFIEDNCDGLGAEIGNRKTGTFGHVSTLSMFPAHHITTGEGGAVFTDNQDLYKIIEQYVSWGRSCWCLPGQDNSCGKRFDHEYDRLPRGYDHKYVFERFGYNLKITDLQASIGASQLNRIDHIVATRRKNFYRLETWLINHYSEYLDTVKILDDASPSPFGFPIILKNKIPFTKSEIVNFLERNGIRTRPLFAGNITRQPMFDNNHYEIWGHLDGADYIMNNVFWIGCHPELTEKHFERIMTVFEDFMRMYK